MTSDTGNYDFGIEEEYFLTDRNRGTVRSRMPPGFMADVKCELGAKHVMHELLLSQIEVCTRPCSQLKDAEEQLRLFRSVLVEQGKQHGLSIVAAGSHPMALWIEQSRTPKQRYKKVVDDLQVVGLSNILCGLHVHVEVPDPQRRVEIMYRMIPFLPVLLALSTSSPFWQRHVTGLLGYRNIANEEMPRSGLPELLRSNEEYDEYVDTLVAAKFIKDASYIWWALRPSLKHPTLELRVTDCCTSLADTFCIVALYRCLVRHLFENPRLHADLTPLDRALAEENKWRAQRYGLNGTYVDVQSRESLPFRAVLDQVRTLVADSATVLQCEAEVDHAYTILRRGTSAHRQLAIYRAAREAGRGRTEALREVVKWLRLSTETGDFADEPEGVTSGSRQAQSAALS